MIKTLADVLYRPEEKWLESKLEANGVDSNRWV
jgi:hypothetical protein